MRETKPLDLPELESLELTVLAEHEVEPGFRSEAAVSYLLSSNQGVVLFDIGLGPALAHNAAKLGVTLADVDALVISHLHLDHMGGMAAQRARRVTLPEALGEPRGQPCFLPDHATAPGFAAEVVKAPRLLPAGLASTGPLARSLFFFDYTEEQSLVARLAGKGLVIVSGCGHPGVEVILEMVRCLSDAPIHAVVGGFHFPVTKSRARRLGMEAQTILGTGKPPWQRITDEDLSRAIEVFNRAGPARMLLSAHDTCDHAIARFEKELDAEVRTLRAGGRIAL